VRGDGLDAHEALAARSKHAVATGVICPTPDQAAIIMRVEVFAESFYLRIVLSQ
jgi:hypothetical protein